MCEKGEEKGDSGTGDIRVIKHMNVTNKQEINIKKSKGKLHKEK